MIIALVAGWLICGLGAAGAMFAYMQEEFKSIAREQYREDLSSALIFGIFFGPIALLSSMAATGFAKHGWRLK